MSDDGFTVHCLASGSSANAVLVACPDGALLIDAGLGMRALRRYVEERGVAPEAVAGICVTHEHGDHTAGAIPFATRWKTPLVATQGTFDAVVRGDAYGRQPASVILRRSDEAGVGPFTVRSFPTTHDAAAPCGFRVSWRGHAVALATDTGSVTPEWRDACAGCQLLVVEANHDVDRLRAGPYPPSLQRRILARDGHLCNEDAMDLVLAHTADHGPAAVWFAHLSEVNNTPAIVRRAWERAWRGAGMKDSPADTRIAGRDAPSLVHRAGASAVQRALF